jgi:hypothetical protein
MKEEPIFIYGDFIPSTHKLIQPYLLCWGNTKKPKPNLYSSSITPSRKTYKKFYEEIGLLKEDKDTYIRFRLLKYSHISKSSLEDILIKQIELLSYKHEFVLYYFQNVEIFPYRNNILPITFESFINSYYSNFIYRYWTYCCYSITKAIQV